MAWSLHTKIHFGFVVALFLLLLVCIVSYRTAQELVETVHQQLSTHRILGELDDVSLDLQNAETGQRGYLLTGEERYLEPYRSAIVNVDRELESLRQLTEQNPSNTWQLDRIEGLTSFCLDST